MSDVNMKNKLMIEVSPLTNTIFVGEILKDGTWAADTHDATIECLVAVAEHVKKFGRPVCVTESATGRLLYKITVE